MPEILLIVCDELTLFVTLYLSVQAVMTLSDGSGLIFSVLEFRSPMGRFVHNHICSSMSFIF